MFFTSSNALIDRTTIPRDNFPFSRYGHTAVQPVEISNLRTRPTYVAFEPHTRGTRCWRAFDQNGQETIRAPKERHDRKSISLDHHIEHTYVIGLWRLFYFNQCILMFVFTYIIKILPNFFCIFISNNVFLLWFNKWHFCILRVILIVYLKAIVKMRKWICGEKNLRNTAILHVTRVLVKALIWSYDGAANKLADAPIAV